MTSAQHLVKDVLNLVSLPAAYFKIRDLVNCPESSIDQIAQVVISDPGLAAQVLKTANSAFFGYRQKVETVSRAINIMGTSRLCDLALAAAAMATFSKIPCELINMTQFWRRSMYCGVISRLLAQRCKIFDSERLFVTGLLADIGHLVIYLKLPDQAIQAMELTKHEQLPLDQSERQLMGMDYAAVGAELMRAWSLPDCIETTTRFQNSPEQAKEFKLEASIVYIASRLATCIYEGRPGKTQVTEFILSLDDFPLQMTGLSADHLTESAEDSHQYIAETLRLLTPKPVIRAG